jgi:hypothetical protein
MTAEVTPIRPGVDDDGDDAIVGADWMSTEAAIDPDTGERSDPFETVRPVAPK